MAGLHFLFSPVMHGIRRDRPPLSVSQLSSLDKYSSAVSLLLSSVAAHRAGEFSEVSAGQLKALTARLVDLNPDFYSLWNYRKEILSSKFPEEKAVADEFCRLELNVATRGLLKNPKCYGAWHHRSWTIKLAEEKFPGLGHSLAAGELLLCDEFLSSDNRNFHCWNFRRFLSNFLGRPAMDDLAFTQAAIEKDFSNFSAWHFRAGILDKIVKQRNFHEKVELLRPELERIRQAIYTDPHDQSIWLVHRWALEQITAEPLEEPGSAALVLSIVDSELSMCFDLLSLEFSCKWGKLAVAQLEGKRRRLREILQMPKTPEEHDKDIEKLKLLDPMRRFYYDFLLAEGK